MLRELHADRHQAITERVSREKDRALEARWSGDRDFDLLRERVRDGGVRVWAEAWRGRGTESFDGRDWRFDGRRTHPDGVPAPGSAADGVKAMLAISGGRVRHGANARLNGRDGPRRGGSRGPRRRAAPVGAHLRGGQDHRGRAQPDAGPRQPRDGGALRDARVGDGAAARCHLRPARRGAKGRPVRGSATTCCGAGTPWCRRSALR